MADLLRQAWTQGRVQTQSSFALRSHNTLVLGPRTSCVPLQSHCLVSVSGQAQLGNSEKWIWK